jgi:hypothetical protein
MPIYKNTIRYYTCKFKCGQKASPKWKMIDHEEKCFCNPANKACRICENFIAGIYESECSVLKLHIKNEEKGHTVYDDEGNEVWSQNSIDIYNVFNDEDPEPRPFPLKNCPHFILGKKRY